ncbi:hypothetical protein KKC83_01330 [Patescibacteria group bacterium]|nr:hypothetical protein [Patescibacteria group bacterium]MBU4073202.1 hypothetical protein [Patescibacteria group bacterium]MBU4102884.1 hypothetical protein [Patescibacteria group bacterium]
MSLSYILYYSIKTQKHASQRLVRLWRKNTRLRPAPREERGFASKHENTKTLNI